MSKKDLSLLLARADLFAKIRNFFFQRKVLEVDCPALSLAAPIDPHIDVMKVYLNNKIGYLHTSPEYRMKRLLSYGIKDIYQLSHVFRDHEFGRWHNPEFTMLEWYRIDWSLEQIIRETLDLLQMALGTLPIHTYTYQEAFTKATKIDCDICDMQELFTCLKAHKIQISDTNWDRDSLIQLVMSSVVEPTLDPHDLTVITDFPKEQAALAKTRLVNQKLVACRFEVYYKTVEIANGYQELTDPQENKLRIEEANQNRLLMGKESLPIDEKFIQDLKLPSCCGVALGFDRLLALKHGLNNLKPILSFAWDET
ncbi:MAG: EF-P lysine aminoacylase EpmA [Candidatus Rhabdochlamydia sp.]|nr:elongation factor P--(R)-beta-lysine ligase [Chlamydiota bacterium]